MSPEEIRTDRRRVEIHARWASVASLALTLGFVAYVLTMCFWR